MRRRRNLVIRAPGSLEIIEEQLPEVPEGGLLLETLVTGLSAGTELAFVKGDHPGLRSRLDPDLGLFLPHSMALPTRSAGSATWKSPG